MKAESTILLIRLSTYAVHVEKNVFTFLRAESLKKTRGEFHINVTVYFPTFWELKFMVLHNPRIHQPGKSTIGM